MPILRPQLQGRARGWGVISNPIKFSVPVDEAKKLRYAGYHHFVGLGFWADICVWAMSYENCHGFLTLVRTDSDHEHLNWLLRQEDTKFFQGSQEDFLEAFKAGDIERPKKEGWVGGRKIYVSSNSLLRQTRDWPKMEKVISKHNAPAWA